MLNHLDYRRYGGSAADLDKSDLAYYTSPHMCFRDKANDGSDFHKGKKLSV